MQFVHKLEQIEKRYEELSQQMADPAVIADPERYRKITKELSELSDAVAKYREWKKVSDALSQARTMLGENDADLRAMAEEEAGHLEPELAKLEDELTALLRPKDPLDDKNVVLEIRAGTGGDEATLFAAEVFRMYSRYGEGLNW